MAVDQQELPQFMGPLVQWPRYGATYRGETFTISPVPTDDGRWIVSINDWTDQARLHGSVVQAIDAALAMIKDSVDNRDAAQAPTPPQEFAPPPQGEEVDGALAE